MCLTQIAASGFSDFQPGRAAHPGWMPQLVANPNSRSSLRSRKYKGSAASAPPPAKKQKVFNSELFRQIRFASANVSTLHPRHEEQALVKQGFSTTPRATLLDSMFAAEDLGVICVQEGRLKNQGKLECYNYIMYIAGASPRGAGGVQIWIRRCLSKFVTAVLVETPWIMQVVLTVGHIVLAVFCGHAPQEGHENGNLFWDTLTPLVAKRAAEKNTFVFLGIDANAHVGSICSSAVGPCQTQEENQNGLRLRMLAEGANLMAANTFFDAGPTWTGSGGHRSRIDYVLTPLVLKNAVEACEALSGLDLATGLRDDHTAVAATLQNVFELILACPEAPVNEHKLEPFLLKRFTKDSLQDPGATSRFQNLLWSHRPWVDVANASPQDIENATAEITDLFKWAAAECFVPLASRPRKKWISERSWAIIAWGAAAPCSCDISLLCGLLPCAPLTFDATFAPVLWLHRVQKCYALAQCWKRQCGLQRKLGAIPC